MMSMMNQKQQSTTQQVANNNPSVQSTLDGLPKQFVASMRTLFDIMDENRTGCIRLSDIETRWREDESKLLPKGVIECLKKVTPANGMLSFERFCTGLRICLLRNRRGGDDKEMPSGGQPKIMSHNITPSVNNNNNSSNNLKKIVPSQTVTPVSRTLSQPVKTDNWSDSDSGARTVKIPPSPSGSSNSSLAGSNSSQNYRNSGSVTATVRPNISSQLRTVSMPLLGENRGVNGAANMTVMASAAATGVHGSTNLGVSSLIGEYGRGNGGRIYRSETRISNLQGVVDSSPNITPPNSNTVITAAPTTSVNGRCVPSRRGIMTVLHNWHMGMLQDAQRGGANKDKVNMEKNDKNSTTAADGNADYRIDIESISTSVKDNANVNKGSLRRREPRRHTLANGIDYNMLKRMKQLEQEKDVLLQGLEAVDKARSWYVQQIDAVQEKMKYIGQNTTLMEYSTEAHQERLNFQMAQIFEVNQHLSVLVESSQRGYPLHMNLAVRQPAYFNRNVQQQEDSATIHQLKEQTVSLSSEVGQKNERILQLEREKAALVRELFQARAHSRTEADDTTLM